MLYGLKMSQDQDSYVVEMQLWRIMTKLHTLLGVWPLETVGKQMKHGKLLMI